LFNSAINKDYIIKNPATALDIYYTSKTPLINNL